MIVFHYDANTNFGDHLNSWLWPALIPELLDGKDDIVLIGVGSIISHSLNIMPGKKIIFGTGSGYRSLPSPEEASEWDIYAVRGPLTARALGLDPKLAITDGAWLVNNVPKYADLSRDRSGTVFVPHWESMLYGNWETICAKADVTLINPLDSCDDIFPALAGAELAIVESLHGAIFADYYGTPWIPVASQNTISQWKWVDWCSSLELEYKPYVLPASDYWDAVLRKQPTAIGSANPESIPVPDNMTGFQGTLQVHNPSTLGQLKNKVKPVLRSMRSSVLENLKFMRTTRLMSSFNEKRSDVVSQYFQNLKSGPSFLSSEAVKSEKIERLNAALETMRQNYSG